MVFLEVLAVQTMWCLAPKNVIVFSIPNGDRERIWSFFVLSAAGYASFISLRMP